MGLGGISDMSGVDCDKVWEEMSSKEFENLSPSSEHNRDSVRKLANLIREALVLLRHTENNRAQRQKLKSRVRKLCVQLARESVLAKRVDSSIS